LHAKAQRMFAAGRRIGARRNHDAGLAAAPGPGCVPETSGLRAAIAGRRSRTESGTVRDRGEVRRACGGRCSRCGAGRLGPGEPAFAELAFRRFRADYHRFRCGPPRHPNAGRSMGWPQGVAIILKRQHPVAGVHASATLASLAGARLRVHATRRCFSSCMVRPRCSADRFGWGGFHAASAAFAG
jgi:hypothetical protein